MFDWVVKIETLVILMKIKIIVRLVTACAHAYGASLNLHENFN